MAAFNCSGPVSSGPQTPGLERDDTTGPLYQVNLPLIAGLALLYLLVGKLSLLFASAQPNTSAVWPPTGIALSAVLLLGYRCWPAIFFGAFFVNATTAVSAATSLGIAVGNTLEALVGGYLVNRFAGGWKVFEAPRNIFKFTLLAALLGTALSASIGIGSLWLGGYVRVPDLGTAWFTWWTGDAAGALIFTPLFVLWGSSPRLHCNRAQLCELALLLAALVMVAGLVFGNVLPGDLRHRPLSFLCIPLLIWCALRFGPREAALASFVLFAIALAGTVDRFGPFAGEPLNTSFMVLLGFLGVMSLTAISVAAGVAQRRMADEARAGLAAIVDSSDDAIIGKTLDGKITSWNTAAQKMFGYTPAQAIGHHVSLIIPPHEVENEQFRVFDRLRRGQAVKLPDTVRLHKDGSLLEVSLAVSPIKDAAGTIIGASSIARDISQHKRLVEALRASEEKFHSMAETVPDILFTMGPDGEPDYTSRRFYDYTGLPKPAGQPISWLNAIHPDDTQRVRDRWQSCIDQGLPFEVEFRLRASDGAYRWFMARSRPIRGGNGRVTKWFGSCTDIEDQKRVQQQREELLRAEQIARAEAEESSRAKDEFLAMLGHELRNPLGAILSSMEILELSRDDGGRAARAKEIMARQLKHLVRLVDDLLDVARVTTGKIELAGQPLNLADSVRLCLNALGEQLSSYEVATALAPVWVIADPTRLEQVITNLMRNAIEYTPSGGKIRVSAGTENDRAIFRIEDNGVGIAADLMPRIFDLFVQDKRGLDRSNGGLGIGLTLAKRLVELHGGTVEAASPGRGRGSTFIVRLPRLAAAPQPPKPDAARNPSAVSRRILVVEDNSDARESLRTILELAGHQTYEAADGLDGVERALELRPDIALIDIGLPGLDGYAVARQIRSSLPGGRIFLIALTGYGQPHDRRMAQEAGFDAHIVKPVDFANLSDTIAKADRAHAGQAPDANPGARPA